MPFLVRKIDRGKWMQNDILTGQDASADAITIDMKTSGNTLSAWQIPSEEQVLEAVLAMTTTGQHIEAQDFVVLNQEALATAGLQLQQCTMATPVTDLIDTHWNIINLTYSSLGILARFIIEEIKNGKNLRRTKGQLQKLIKQAIEDGRVDTDALSQNLKSKLC
jgi:hypothetical protein